MLKYFIAHLFILLFCFHVFGQNKLYVTGKITDANTGKPVEHVHVKAQQQNVLAVSNTKGVYAIVFYRKEYPTLIFSHTTYTTFYEPLNTVNDTVYLDVKLVPKIEVLTGVEITSKKEPEIVFKSAKISISDYEFYEDKYIFLAYEKRLNKNSELYLVDENETILASHFIPGEPVELYTDYLGNINLICKTSIYRIGIDNEK